MAADHLTQPAVDPLIVTDLFSEEPNRFGISCVGSRAMTGRIGAADLDTAVAGAMIAKFRNGGQACTAANRIYVHSAVAFDFTARFGAEVEKLSVGAAADRCGHRPVDQPGRGTDAVILREELFGPVAPIVPWHDEDELVAQVNDTEYGLAAYVFAGELGRALRLGERIEAGMIGINRGLVSDPSAPFGG